MAFCGNCGRPSAGTRFCPDCGVAMTGAPPAAPVPPAYQPDPPAQPAPPSQPATWAQPGAPTPGGSQGKLLALAAVVVLVVVSAGIGIFLAQRSEKYPEAVRTTFLQACQESGVDYSTCECALEEFESQYSFREFRRLEARVLTAESEGDLPREVIDVYADCS